MVFASVDPPGAPISLEANDVTPKSCTLTWQPPEFDGGSPVTGYYVERRSGTRWVKANKKPITSCRFNIDDLSEGHEYEFRVCAENEAGIGEPSETTGKFIAKNPYDVPGQPEAPVVSELSVESATLTWQPPTSDGGADIVSYVVEMKTGSSIKWTVVNKAVKDTTFVVSGLREETSYEFRVAAENKAGVGKASPPSSAVKYGKSRVL